MSDRSNTIATIGFMFTVIAMGAAVVATTRSMSYEPEYRECYFDNITGSFTVDKRDLNGDYIRARRGDRQFLWPRERLLGCDTDGLGLPD